MIEFIWDDKTTYIFKYKEKECYDAVNDTREKTFIWDQQDQLFTLTANEDYSSRGHKHIMVLD